MDRRQFSKTLASAFAVAALPAPPFLRARANGRSAYTLDAARLNRHLKELAAFGANPQGGVSRVAYSDADRAGRAFVMQKMRDAGLDVRVDFAGNIFGRRA